MADKIKPGRLCSQCNKSIRKTCPGYDWWPPSEIRYCFNQLFWIIESDILDGGEYPPDPYVSGYVGGGMNGIKATAPYEMVRQIAGEINARLWTHGRTGEAGEALIDEVRNQHITVYYMLSRPAQRVMRYIAGSWRKRQTYSDWKSHMEKGKFTHLISEDMKNRA